MVSVTISYDRHEWGIGIVVNLPHGSKKFYNNVKFRSSAELTIWLGPFELNAGGDRIVTAYICASCGFEQTGQPAFIGPVPGVVLCEDCLANHRPAKLDYNSEHGFAPCEHNHDDDQV